jgi:hypothetical protein
MDEERVDGTREGVALRELRPSVDVLLRSLSLRVNEGNLVSILLLMLFADDSADRRRLEACDSKSLLKLRVGKSLDKS